MTKGNPVSLILAFALPVFLSQVFQQLYNTADSLIVGNFLGTSALAAVSSSGTLIFLFIGFFTGLTMGAGVVIGRYFGAGETDNVSRAIHANLVVGLVSGLFLTVAGVIFTPTLLRWMNTDEAYMDEAVEYFRWYFSGAVAMVMYNTFKATMNALGDSKRPLYYLIFSSLLNIALDLLFIGAFGWGVWSAAVATVISQLASCVLCLVRMMSPSYTYRVSVKKLRFDRLMLREIIRLGVPSGVQNSVIALANVVVQSQINTFGEFATAGFGTHAKIEGFAFLPITSFNMALTTYVSQNLGAGLYERAKKGARFGILAAMISAELIGIGHYLLADRLVALFDQTPEVIAYGTTQAHTVTLFYCLLAFSHAVAAVCRGAGKAVVPMAVMLCVWCVIRVIYIIIVMKFVNEIRYIYWAYPITWCISSVIYLLYYLFSDWVHGFEQDHTRKMRKRHTA
ncbi:MAG: MATE family efflux transporter [Clostridiales bacterium]|nr:MATE family efflux transporter [Clostridiales bacterium]